jgi:tripartite-type tricarboxylate transporter receptor subunit TctC
MNRIPFRGGPQVVQEMIAGRVDFYVSPTLGVVPQYEAKQLRLLAVSAPARLPKVPQVPTLKEAGIDYVRFGWLGICAAEGTPQPIIDRLNREIVSIVATPDYAAMIENAGSIAMSSTPEQLSQVIKQTLDDVSATIREFGLQQER